MLALLQLREAAGRVWEASDVDACKHADQNSNSNLALKNVIRKLLYGSRSLAPLKGITKTNAAGLAVLLPLCLVDRDSDLVRSLDVRREV